MSKKEKIQSQEETKKVSNSKFNFEFNIYSIVALFLVTTFVFFHKQIMGETFFWEDIVEFVYPIQNFAATQKGIAFWNPYSFAGMPFYADLQVGFFYPFNRLLDFFVTNGKLSFGALQLVIILHYFISQINFYFLAKYFKVSSIGAIIGAISYTFSMVMICHSIHPMIVFHLSWFPLVFLFFVRGISESNLKFTGIAGLLLGMSLLSGHPQTTLYEGLILGITGLFLLITERKNILIRLIAMVLPIALAGGIFAIQLLPSQELAKLSRRNEVSYKLATEGSMQFKQVLNLVNPHTFGSIEGSNQDNSNYFLKFDGVFQRHFFWETTAYFGIAALILGFIAVVYKYKDRNIQLFAIIALFSFLMALGSNGFLFNILYNLPLIGTFRNPARMMAFAAFGFSIMAGFGFDALTKIKDRKILALLIPVGIVLLLSVIVASGNHLEEGITADALSLNLTSQLAFVVIISSLLAGLYFRMFNSKIIGLVLIAVCFVDLYYYGGTFNSSATEPMKNYEVAPQLLNQFKPKSADSLFRINMRMYRPSYMAMNRSQGLIDQIMLIEGYNPLILQKCLPPLKNTADVFDIYNVKYEIGIDSTKGQPVFKERSTYFPRVWVVKDYVVSASDEASVKANLQKDSINLRKLAVLEEDPKINKSNDSLVYTAKITKFENNQIEIEAESNQEALLCLSEIYYPAWKAFVNEAETKILVNDYCFRAIKIGKGKSKIRMEYISESYAKGKYISLASLLIALALIFIPWKRNGEGE